MKQDFFHDVISPHVAVHPIRAMKKKFAFSILVTCAEFKETKQQLLEESEGEID